MNEACGPEDAPRKHSPPVPGIILGILACVLLVTYGGVLRHGFVQWDDDLHITENPFLNPPTGASLVQFWRRPYEDLYIPLSYMFFAGEVAAADLWFPRGADGSPDPLVFKAGSLLLHLGCACLVWVWLSRWTNNHWSALLGALLFAVHPLQVESVAWTSETRGLLAGLLGLGALAVHGRPSPATPDQRLFLREGVAIGLFVAGMLAKPTVVAVAPMVLMIDVLGAGLSWQRAVWRALPWCFAAAAVTILTSVAQPETALPFSNSLVERGRIACDTLAVQTWHSIALWPRGIDYGRTPEVALSSWTWFVGLALLGLIALSVVRGPVHVGLAAALFLAGLLPTLGLQPFGFQAISTVADRYAYLALLGPALALSWLMERQSPIAHWLVLGAVMVPLAVVAHLSVNVWSSNEALFRNAVAVNPRSSIGWNNLGDTLFRAGKLAEAERAFRRALEFNPQSSVALYNLGVFAERQGDDDAAGRRFRQAAELPQARATATLAWARWLDRHDRKPEALEWYLQTLALDPHRADALTETATLLNETGKTRQAKALLKSAIAQYPQAWTARVAYGHLLLAEGDDNGAAAFYRDALRIRSDLPEPLFNLGLLAARRADWDAAAELLTQAQDAAVEHDRQDLATGATQELTGVLLTRGLSRLDRNDATGAVTDFERACAVDPQSIAAHFHRGRALERLGRPAEAREALRIALTLAPAGSEPARDIQSVLDEIGDQQP